MNGHIMGQLDSSRWSTTNPSSCPCRGSGWLGSDFDTWHKCRIHHRGQPHPEDDGDAFDYDGTRLALYREAYAAFGRLSGLPPMVMVRAALAVMEGEPTPASWTNAAEQVAREIEDEALHNRAQAAGYSCRLEAAWAADGAVEAGALARGLDPETYAPSGSPEAADRDSWYPRS